MSAYRSGHCTPGAGGHERCAGAYAAATCTCTCHTAPPLPRWLALALGAATLLPPPDDPEHPDPSLLAVLTAALAEGGWRGTDTVTALTDASHLAGAAADVYRAMAEERVEHEAAVRSS